MLVAYTLGAAVVVGAIISLATNSWLFLVIAVAIHLAASAFFLVFTMKRVNQGDKPDPVTEAHMEAGDVPEDRGGQTRSGRYGDREVVH
jgi:membrane protein implicated in regulation of membrane protease activity